MRKVDEKVTAREIEAAILLDDILAENLYAYKGEGGDILEFEINDYLVAAWMDDSKVVFLGRRRP